MVVTGGCSFTLWLGVIQAVPMIACQQSPFPPRSPEGEIARLFACKRGATAILAAALLTALLFFTGLTVDFGLALYTKRQLQAATDFAALAAAQNTTRALGIATDMLVANNFGKATIDKIDVGDYVPDPTLPPVQRFRAGGVPLNAVQVGTSFPVPMRFVSALVPNAALTVAASAAAAQVTEAGLVAGSGLASESGGLANAILGAMLGTQLSLDAVSYNGLTNAHVNALDLLDALAGQANVTAGTYGNLLNGSVTMGQLVNAEIAALNKEGSISGVQLQAIQALRILSAQVAGSPSIALGSLLNVGFWSNAPVGSIDPSSALQASLNIYQVMSFAAQIANGSHLVQAADPISIPGIATVDIAMTAIEPPESAYLAVGPTGTTVHTAQIRIQLTVKLLNGLNVGGLLPLQVTLPIYIEVASGTASVETISCGNSPAIDAAVGVDAHSGVATAYVGQVSPAAMSNSTSDVTPGPALIVTIGPAQVTGQAKVSIQGNTQHLTFDQSQISTLTPQTISSTNMSSNLLAGLQSSLILQTQPGGLPAAVPLLGPLLSPAFAGLDAVTDQILRTLGVRVGYLDITVNGVRCGVPALIQ